MSPRPWLHGKNKKGFVSHICFWIQWSTVKLVVLVIIKNSNGPILVLNTQLCKMVAYNRICLIFGFQKTSTNLISQGSFVIATSSCLLKDITVGLFMLLPYPYTLYLPYTLHPFRRPYSQCLCMPYPQSNPDAPSFSDLHHIKYYGRYIYQIYLCVFYTSNRHNQTGCWTDN